MNHRILFSKIRCLVGFALLVLGSSAFSPIHTRQSKTACYNWLGDLWEEVIEFSTYGPSERKILKERREQAAKEKEGEISVDSFQQAQQKYATSSSSTTTSASSEDQSTVSASSESDSLSLGAFQAAVAKDSSTDQDMDFDGYKLRDLLVEKWGAPLDVNFSRGNSGKTVYCSVLPVAFGSSKCRHATEMDYLMHLQAIVEVLKKYDNLDPFVFFVQTTSKTPRPGVESAPYKMQLSEQQLKQIL